MMPADLKRLHKYMLDVEHIGIISDEMRGGGRRAMARAGTQAAAENPKGLTHGDRWQMSALPPVNPSALAALRFTTSSKVTGCCIGRSAGFAPRSILSM